MVFYHDFLLLCCFLWEYIFLLSLRILLFLLQVVFVVFTINESFFVCFLWQQTNKQMQFSFTQFTLISKTRLHQKSTLRKKIDVCKFFKWLIQIQSYSIISCCLILITKGICKYNLINILIIVDLPPFNICYHLSRPPPLISLSKCNFLFFRILFFYLEQYAKCILYWFKWR